MMERIDLITAVNSVLKGCTISHDYGSFDDPNSIKSIRVWPNFQMMPECFITLSIDPLKLTQMSGQSQVLDMLSKLRLQVVEAFKLCRFQKELKIPENENREA